MREPKLGETGQLKVYERGIKNAAYNGDTRGVEVLRRLIADIAWEKIYQQDKRLRDRMIKGGDLDSAEWEEVWKAKDSDRQNWQWINNYSTEHGKTYHELRYLAEENSWKMKS